MTPSCKQWAATTGQLLFLGLGTGLGTALIVDGKVQPMELGHLPYEKGTYEQYVGRAGLERVGEKMWRRRVDDVVERLIAALRPDETVLGGGNVRRAPATTSGLSRGSQCPRLSRGFSVVGKRQSGARIYRQAAPAPPQKI